MTARSRAAALLLAFALAALVAACGDDGGGDEARSTSTTTAAAGESTTSTAEASTTTTTAPSTTTTVALVPWRVVPAGGAAVLTSTGLVLPVVRQAGESFVVQTPCAREATVGGTPLGGANIVIDPGHGGVEPGAVGPAGLKEKDVNLAVAQELERILAARGATVVLTRTGDYRIALATRALIATALKPDAFVSVHHNAAPDGPWPGPGSESYYQMANPESKRLAGLIWEEVTKAFGAFEADWVADRDAGAKYRPSSSGGDYYGILRRTAGVNAVLSEAAFVSNPTEEALLATAEFRHAEAEAIADALVRFIDTDDPGSGFVEPYPREEPAGGGGGTSNCVDPALG